MATVESVMTRDPMCCTPDEGVVDCARMMARGDVGFLPVVESRDTRRLVGVITDRDLCLSVIAEGRSPDECLVNDCMTDNVVTCAPGEPLEAALALMQSHQIRRVVVVDERGSCVGVLAPADIARNAIRSAPGEATETVAEIAKST